MATQIKTSDVPSELTDHDTLNIDDREKLRGAAKKEAFFREKEKKFTPFSFKRPDDIPEGRRAHVRLCKGSLVRGTVQEIGRAHV